MSMNPVPCRKSAAALMVATLSLIACNGGSNGSGNNGPPFNPATPLRFRLEPAFPNLLFIQPVAMLQAPDDRRRWFVVEQAGEVRVFDNNPVVTSGSSFVDIRGRVISGDELGLLGMAFHPNFPLNPRVYLSYTHLDAGLGLVSRISEFTTPDNGLTLDPNSEQVLITIEQPESNHNGGGIVFGPDGFLYIGMGDGGGANDPHGTIGNGQLLTTLLGKMLRIDISAGAGGMLYRIPASNPFAGNTPCGATGVGLQNCPEIYAWGFRNPWRWSFDRATGELWVGDVGQSALEEVDRVVLGGNYGWRCFEGTRNTGLACGAPPSISAPIAEYGRTVGTTVTGGYVYNGTAIPDLVGSYVFGDFGSGRIWAIAADTAPTLTMTDSNSLASGLSISSFAEDNDGELYVVHYGGTLHRIVAN
jgi:glucose/arabinose dehydrogenase